MRPRVPPPRSVYLHFICCTVTRRIREAVAVKPTLKKLRRDKFPKGASFDAPLHSVVACIGGFFYLTCGCARGRTHMCITRVCLSACERERGARRKNYEEPGDSEFRSVLCQLRYAIRGAAHVTRSAMQRYFLVGCTRLWKSAALDWSTSEKRRGM